MNFQELKPICERLNKNFAGKLLPTTNWTVKEFVIIPDEVKDPAGFENCVNCMNIGVSRADIDLALENHPYLNIRIIFNDDEMQGYYHPENFGLTVKTLDSMK